MKISYSGFALRELRDEVDDTCIPWIAAAIQILKYDVHPSGLYSTIEGEIEVESGPVDIFTDCKYKIYTLKIVTPYLEYRVLYYIDNEHDVIVITSVGHRDKVFKRSRVKMIQLQVEKYYENEGWYHGL